eukprot:2533596-Pyramimonas_sp.AAC.2
MELIARSVRNDPNVNTFIRWVGSEFDWESCLGGESAAEYHRSTIKLRPYPTYKGIYVGVAAHASRDLLLLSAVEFGPSTAASNNRPNDGTKYASGLRTVASKSPPKDGTPYRI